MFAEMVHFIDLALWFNRQSYPVRLFAEGSCRGNFALILKFADGSITVLQHSMTGNFDYPKELFEVTVNNITIAMDHHMEVRQMGLMEEPAIQTFPYSSGSTWAGEPGMTGYMKNVSAEQEKSFETGSEARYLDVNKGHYEHLDRFLDCIEGTGENPCSVESAVPVNRIAAKFLESARLGLPLAVSPEDWHLPGIRTI
jgi:predicted dehydrogenase